MAVGLLPLVLVGLGVIGAFFRTDASVSLVPAAAGMAVVIVWTAVGYMAGQAVWRLSGRRWGSNLAFCIVCLSFLPIGIVVAKAGHRDRKQAADNERLQIRAGRLREATAAIAAAEEGEPKALAMESAARLVGGEEARALRGMAELIRQMYSRRAATKEVVSRYLDAGHVDPSGIESIEEIDSRLLLNAEAKAAVMEGRDWVASLEGHAQRSLAEKGVSQASMERPIRIMLESTRVDLITAIIDLDIHMLYVNASMLQTLRSEWGAWEYDPSDETVYFESDSALERYVTLQQDLLRAAAEQERLEQQLHGAD